jgi:hypothetical protein
MDNFKILAVAFEVLDVGNGKEPLRHAARHRQPCKRDLRFTRARHAASGGLLLGTFASRCSALLQLLPQAVGLDQHILRISKLLLPLVARSAKVGPVSLLALRGRFSSRC